MTPDDVSLALWLLILTLAISALVSASLIASLLRPWWVSIRDKTNGPKTAVLRGTMRRRLIQLALHLALLVQFGARAVTHRAAPILITIIIVLVIVLALITDAVGDMFDYRLLRGLLKDADRHDG